MFKKLIAGLCIFLPSGITCIIYRLLGHKIGRNVKISFFSFVYAEEISLGNDVEIRNFVFINVSKLSLGNSSVLGFGVQIKGDKRFLTKDNCFIGVHSIINCDEDVIFGFYSGLGPRCIVYSHGSFLPVIKGYPAVFKKIEIEDYVWVGMDVKIMPGTSLKSNCIIAPGMVLNGTIKPNTLMKMNPTTYSNFDLTKIQKFAKKDNAYYHEEIISSFCQYYGLNFEHDKDKHSFYIEEKYCFKYIPNENILELHISNGKKIVYDLDNYFADFSRIRIHHNFLFYIRRRYGLTLRTKY